MSVLTDIGKQKTAAPSGSSDDTEPPGAVAQSESTSKSVAKAADKHQPKATPAKGCRVRVRFQTEDCTPPLTRWLKEQFERLIELAKVRQGDITLVIVADEQMAKMHEQYTGVKGTTDVLTFDYRDDQRQPIESDLILCLDTATREASARGHETRVEILLYALHGLNHLLGGDDHTPKAADAMHQWEDQILTAAGFGAVFKQPVQPVKADTTRTPKRSAKESAKGSAKKPGGSGSQQKTVTVGKAGSDDPRRWSNRKARIKKKNKNTHHPT